MTSPAAHEGRGRRTDIVLTVIASLLLIAPVSALILVPYAWLNVLPITLGMLLVGALSMALLSRKNLDGKRVWWIAASAGAVASLYYIILGVLAGGRLNAPVETANVIVLAFLVVPTLFVFANSVAVFLVVLANTKFK